MDCIRQALILNLGREVILNWSAKFKYAFLLDPVSQTAVSGSLTLEFPTGNSDVFQGEGKGLANLIVAGGGFKLLDRDT